MRKELYADCPGERWSVLRHCHEVFDRLSDAVLADAIKLQTSSQASQQAPPVAHATFDFANDNRHERPTNSTYSAYLHGPGSATQSNAVYPNSLHLSPLAVDNEFLHCFDDLQQLYNQQQLEDPVMHLSQDWLAYLGGPFESNGYSDLALGTTATMS